MYQIRSTTTRPIVAYNTLVQLLSDAVMHHISTTSQITSLEIHHEFYLSYLCAIPYVHDGLFRATTTKRSE